MPAPTEVMSDAEVADLLPKAPPAALAPRRLGLLSLAVGLLAAACCAALVVSRRPPSARGREWASAAVMTVETALQRNAAAGDDEITLQDAGTVEIGDVIVVGKGTDQQDFVRVAEVGDNGVITLSYGLTYAHDRLSAVSLTTHSVGENATGLAGKYYLSVPLGADASSGDKQVTLTQYCDDFELGDEIQLESEFNLITDITQNNDGSCLLDLAYSLQADHTTESMLSKKIDAPPPTVTTTTVPTTVATTIRQTTTTKKEVQVQAASEKKEKSSCGGLPRVGLAVLMAACVVVVG